jgi:lysozyme
MEIVAQLRRDEGVRNFPYTDTVGKLTIGVGRNLTDVGLSDPEINFLLQIDIQRVTNTLHFRLPWFQALDPVRQGALVNLCFNVGFSKLEKFEKMLIATAQGDWETASTEMLNSAWAKEVGDRADRLAQQMRTGEWV